MATMSFSLCVRPYWPHVSTRASLWLCLLASLCFAFGAVILTLQGFGSTLLSCGAVGNVTSSKFFKRTYPPRPLILALITFSSKLPGEVSVHCRSKSPFVDILDDGSLFVDSPNGTLLEPHLGQRYFVPTEGHIIACLCVGVVATAMPMMLWRAFQGEVTIPGPS